MVNQSKAALQSNAFWADLARTDKLQAAHLDYLLLAIEAFVAGGSQEDAFLVYEMFLDNYRFAQEGQKRFIDLFDALHRYEENAAVLSDRQRDHIAHSVNVFLLGLDIYAGNASFRAAFSEQICLRINRPHFSLIQEEFLFVWGIAALFHDIGYPVEIISNQIKKYIAFVGSPEGDSVNVRPFIDYQDFPALDSIRPLPQEAGIELARPTELLASSLSLSFDLPIAESQKAVGGHLQNMQKNGFVDHGFYSAVILLKWYGELLQAALDGKDLFSGEITLAAEAILLHNFYYGSLQKPPFNLAQLDLEQNPLAYLLILSDELQEWNRIAYGEKDRGSTLFIEASDVAVTDDDLRLTFITSKGIFAEDFAAVKHQGIAKRLNIASLFPGGLKLDCETAQSYYLEHRLNDIVIPRLLINQLEELARLAHEDYVQIQRERNPDLELEFPTWESLTPSLKFSNIRQAATIGSKLEQVDCYLSESEGDCLAENGGLAKDGCLTANGGLAQKDGHQVTIFSEAEVEVMARYEHQLWVKERLESGWVYAEVKDAAKKQSPYLVAYDELSEDIKQLDRDTILNIIPFVSRLGLKVCRASELKSSAETGQNWAVPARQKRQKAKGIFDA